MPTNNEKKLPTLSYADLIAAEVLKNNHQLPPVVTQLPTASQTQLLSGPLIPVLINHPSCAAQIELLKSFCLLPRNRDLGDYCRGLLRLRSSPAAWNFIVAHGKPAHSKTADAVRAGELTDKEGPAISNLGVHWSGLQRYIGAATNAPTSYELVSLRTPVANSVL